MSETVLCIDDDSCILTLYKTILQESGYEVLTESNGRDGLAVYGRYPVDCVVLDYQMPEMDGAEFVRGMMSRHSSIPVILISGSSAIPPELLALVDAFIEKPVGMRRLLDCVENLTRSAGRRPRDHAFSISPPTRS